MIFTLKMFILNKKIKITEEPSYKIKVYLLQVVHKLKINILFQPQIMNFKKLIKVEIHRILLDIIFEVKKK